MHIHEGWATVGPDTIHYQMMGAFVPGKPFIIFLHEGLGSIPQWKTFPEELCRRLGLPALLYERPGYKQSTPPAETRPADFLKREGEAVLPGLLKALHLAGPHYVFGHSDGGTVALYYAAIAPAGLKSITTVAPHVLLEPVSRESIRKIQEAFSYGKLKGALDKYHAPNTTNVVLSWTRYWLDPDNKDWNMYEELKTVKCPVFLIQGEKDMFGTIKQATEIEKRIKGPFKKLFLKNCGHSPHLEQKETVLDNVAGFFS